MNAPNPIPVLIVEDERFLVELLSPILSDEYELTHATTVKDALHLLATQAFQLVLLDLDLGDVEDKAVGITLIRPIRQAGAKVIIVSARCNGHVGVQCLFAGIHGYVDKHQCVAHLKETMARVLAGRADLPGDWLAALADLAPMPEMDTTQEAVLLCIVRDWEMPDEEIGRRVNRSVGRVRNVVTELNGLFDVKGRDKLMKAYYRHRPRITFPPELQQ